ncbi:hypothetical protein T484DRAFT_1862487 [Cryptophyta sp. CCMP2293]|nr:hypothetical protein T484DRAFT_1862487 [Cryptophyta sp. CCMP2293]
MAPKVTKEKQTASDSQTPVVETGDGMAEFQKLVGGARDDFDSLQCLPCAGSGMSGVRGVQAQNSRNAVVLAVNHKPIACSEAGYSDSWSVTPLTVVRVEEAGFSKAPFARGMSKVKMADAKPLAVIEDGDLRMWSFKKVPMAKGDRDDTLSFKISAGDTFNIFMDLNKFKEMKRLADPSQHMLPTSDELTVIPAFSLVEVTLASKNSESALDKRSCVNILKVRRIESDVSMHSVRGVLGRLPASLNDALLACSSKAVDMPCISQDLVKDKVAFYRKTCNTETYCEEVEMADEAQTGAVVPFVRLSGWSTDPTEDIATIDVPGEALLRLCNATKLEHAIAFLQVAFAMEAVSLFVTHNPFLSRSGGSALRGVPLVDVCKMMAGAKFNPQAPGLISTKSMEFDTGCSYHDGEGDGEQQILMRVEVDPSVSSDDPDTCKIRPSQDFPAMLPGYTSNKMYACTTSFDANTKTADPPKKRVDGVVLFHLDVAKRCAASSMFANKKRKLVSMQWQS